MVSAVRAPDGDNVCRRIWHSWTEHATFGQQTMHLCVWEVRNLPLKTCGTSLHDNDDDDVEGEGEVLDEIEGAVCESAICARERERPQVPVRAGVRQAPLCRGKHQRGEEGVWLYNERPSVDVFGLARRRPSAQPR